MNPITLYVAISFFLLSFLESDALILPVGHNQNIQTIQRALVVAQHGDTILVKPGTYREGNILVSKTVVILGESKPTIDGENKHEVFSVRANGVVISGFRIINSGISSMHDLAGIGAENADYLTIKNNVFENTFFGVHLSNSNFAWIENNLLRSTLRADHQSGNGIHLWKCENASILNNQVSYHRDGIYFEFVTNSKIIGNLSTNNLRYGLHFMFSHHDTYTENTFKNNGAGVAVMYTHHLKMYDNNFEDNWGAAAYGLLLKEISDSIIKGNTFTRNTVGILMEGTSRGDFSGNTFLSNGWAVKLQASCDDNSFTGNNFLSNTFDIVTNGTMVLNTFKHNYWDKYQGYDLNKDQTGDVPFRPVSMFATVMDRIPTSVMLWRSFLVFLLDKSEQVIPAITPENLKDEYPKMRAYDFSKAGM